MPKTGNRRRHQPELRAIEGKSAEPAMNLLSSLAVVLEGPCFQRCGKIN